MWSTPLSIFINDLNSGTKYLVNKSVDNPKISAAFKYTGGQTYLLMSEPSFWLYSLVL